MPTIIKLTVATAAALLGLTLGAGRAHADDVPLPTAQAKAMHAEFLTQAPTPPNPGVTCIVDTGVNSNYDTDAALIGRESIYPGDGSDGDPDAHHGTYLAMNIAAPANGWGMVGIAPQTRILSIRAIESGAHTFQSQSYTQRLGPRALIAKVNGGVNVDHRAARARARGRRHHRRRPSRPKQDRPAPRPTGSPSSPRPATTAAGCSGRPVLASVRGRWQRRATAISATRARVGPN